MAIKTNPIREKLVNIKSSNFCFINCGDWIANKTTTNHYIKIEDHAKYKFLLELSRDVFLRHVDVSTAVMTFSRFKFAQNTELNRKKRVYLLLTQMKHTIIKARAK